MEMRPGLNVRPSMELGYHWPGGAWFWSSGLTVPVGEWSHVALVVRPTDVTVYLNGKAATQVTAAAAVDFTEELFIGSYQGWGGRNFDGKIDELAIYSRALTQAEIRSTRHLTKKPADDPDLLAYYQFNRADGAISDRAGNRHAIINGNAARSRSRAPIGGGSSASLDVTTGGSYSWAGTGFNMQWPGSATVPNGEVVVSRLNVSPDTLPSMDENASSYWVVNNYGTNNFFGNPSSLHIDGYGPINAAQAANPFGFKLYKRTENAAASSWIGILEEGDLATEGPEGSVTFQGPLFFADFGQFAFSREVDECSFPVANLQSTILPTGVQFSWDPLTYQDVAAYRIQGRKIGAPSFRWLPGVVFAPATSITVSGAQLEEGETYEWRVIGGCYPLDGSVTTAFSSIASFIWPTSLTAKNGFALSPNPVSDQLTVTFSNAFEEDDLLMQLVQLDGKVVLSRKLTAVEIGSSLQLPVGQLSPGSYSLILENNGKTRSEQFTISR